MNCAAVREQLTAYRDGELAEAAAGAVAAHLAGCAGCRLELDRAQETRALLGTLAAEQWHPAVHDDVVAAVAAGGRAGAWAGARPGGWAGVGRWARLGLQVAAAAVLIAGFVWVATWRAVPDPAGGQGGPAGGEGGQADGQGSQADGQGSPFGAEPEAGVGQVVAIDPGTGHVVIADAAAGDSGHLLLGQPGWPVRRASAPAWSPDGRRLAFVGADGRLWVHTISPVSTFSPEVSHAASPAWSPDGQRLAFVAAGGDGRQTVYTIPAGGGTPRDVLPGGLASRRVSRQVVRWVDDDTVAYWEACGTGCRLLSYVRDQDAAGGATGGRNDGGSALRGRVYAGDTLTSGPMATEFHFSPDASLVALQDAWPKPWQLTVARRAGEVLFDQRHWPGTMQRFWDWSPDGRYLLFTAWDEVSGRVEGADVLPDLYRLDVRTGAVERVAARAGWAAYAPDGRTLAYLQLDRPGTGARIELVQAGAHRFELRVGLVVGRLPDLDPRAQSAWLQRRAPHYIARDDDGAELVYWNQPGDLVVYSSAIQGVETVLSGDHWPGTDPAEHVSFAFSPTGWVALVAPDVGAARAGARWWLWVLPPDWWKHAASLPSPPGDGAQ